MLGRPRSPDLTKGRYNGPRYEHGGSWRFHRRMERPEVRIGVPGRTVS